MAGAKRKEKRLKRRLINQKPEQRYTWLLSLRESTDCILKIEDKYRIYRRLEGEFYDLAELTEEEAAGFTEQEKCTALAEECGRIADELEPQVPEDARKVSRTVMMSAGERAAEDRKNEGGHSIARWVILSVFVLIVAFIVCFKIPATRVYIGGLQEFVGMQTFAVKSYRVGGDHGDGWEKAVALEKKIIKKTEPGQKVHFGKLEWIVLRHENGKTLLFAYNPLKDRVFHKDEGAITWEKCSLREKLNSRFLDNNFYPHEKEAIAQTEVEEYDAYGQPTGVTVSDQVFIASSEDVMEYEDKLDSKINNMRLRDPGMGEGTTAFVSAEGDIIDYGFPTDMSGCYIRPMMWVNTD